MMLSQHSLLSAIAYPAIVLMWNAPITWAVKSALIHMTTHGLTSYPHLKLKKKFKKGSDAIVKSIGVAPTLMRPPGGCVNGTVKSNVGLPMILWSVDTRDWETRSTPTTISEL